MDRTISIEMYRLLVNMLMILGVSSLLRVLFAVIFKKKKRIIFLIHFIVVVLFDYFLFKFLALLSFVVDFRNFCL